MDNNLNDSKERLVKTIRPGQTVYIGDSRGDSKKFPAKVKEARVTTSGVEYHVEWWDGRSLKSATLAPCQVGSEGGIRTDLIGFKRERAAEREAPAEGSRWRRSDAGTDFGYEVLFVTNTENVHERHPSQVVYVGDNGHHWSLPLSEWPGNLVPEEGD